MFNIDQLRIQIETLIREYPELVDDDALREDMLDGSTDMKQALSALVRRCGDTIAMLTAIEARLEDMSTRRKRFERRVEALRELMLSVMQSADLKKIELPEASLSQRNRPPSLVGDVDPADLPDDLVKISRTVDRAKVREALESGRFVPGFTLSNSRPSLTVRVK